MEENIIQYSFSKDNTNTMVFVPGYSGGLETPILKILIEYYVQKGGCNIFGVLLPYKEDAQDAFDDSQKTLILHLEYIKSLAPNTDIILCAKSLGGSLALYNYAKLPISKLIILGCSIVLGWPQKISLLNIENPSIPNYKVEWADTLRKVNVPLLIISGERDDLCDNEFLMTQSRQNQNINTFIVGNAGHDLMSSGNEKSGLNECVFAIDQFITSDKN